MRWWKQSQLWKWKLIRSIGCKPWSESCCCGSRGLGCSLLRWLAGTSVQMCASYGVFGDSVVSLSSCESAAQMWYERHLIWFSIFIQQMQSQASDSVCADVHFRTPSHWIMNPLLSSGPTQPIRTRLDWSKTVKNPFSKKVVILQCPLNSPNCFIHWFPMSPRCSLSFLPCTRFLVCVRMQLWVSRLCNVVSIDIVRIMMQTRP